MANYGSSSLSIQFDNSGGTLQNMTPYVLTINGVEVEAILEESHSFGDSWFESLATGMRKMNPVVMGGLYEDTPTTGPDAIFNAPAATVATASRTLLITWGGTKTTQSETLIQKYSRMAQRAALTKYEVTVQPTGAVTEA